MTVAQLVDRLTVHELQDWQVFYSEHPFPADLIDIHGAQMCALTANLNRANGVQPFPVTDFMVIRPRMPAVAPVKAKPKITEAQRIRAFFESGG